MEEPLRTGAHRPLSRLLERGDSKIFAKLKSNALIQADPPEIHFSGFELGKDYTKILKLTNISSEVVNIHVIPTQTKHFLTTPTKTCRLIPGLASTLKVKLRPDEWRYFYDCVRVRCQGEENLLVPVHAYPAVDDLRVPPRIDLPAVPLGQSVRHAIPLTGSSPVDFEFQVCVIQPHDAFSILPLTGVVPADGEGIVTVTFRPVRYETCQFTFQLSVSQFNSRPHLCTVTGSSAPLLPLSDSGRRRSRAEHKGPPRRRKTETTTPPKTPAEKERRGAKGVPRPPLAACAPAGVAKMLIKGRRQTREAASGHAKEAVFLKKVRLNAKEEQENQLRWQVRLGKDPMSESSRRLIVERRASELHEYMVKRGDISSEEDFAPGQPKLSSARVLREAGQACEGTPRFQFYSDFRWEIRRRALRRFQQAARKVVIGCRLRRRLTCLKETRTAPETRNVAVSPLSVRGAVKIFPLAFPVFGGEEDPPSAGDLLPVDPVGVAVATQVPFFKPQVPQLYQLMGYQPVSTWEAFTSYVPSAPPRPLRAGAETETPPESARLSFSAPDALLKPPPADPLRIFNAAPGLQAYAPTPKYLETEAEFHLCPLPRYPIPESSGSQSPRPPKASPHRRVVQSDASGTFCRRQEVTPGLAACKDIRSIAAKWLPRSVDYSADILPPLPPLPPPDHLLPLMDTNSGVQLTPEIIRAQFLSGGASVANSNHTRGTAARLQTEATSTSPPNQMGQRVASRLKQLRGRAAGENQQ